MIIFEKNVNSEFSSCDSDYINDNSIFSNHSDDEIEDSDISSNSDSNSNNSDNEIWDNKDKLSPSEYYEAEKDNLDVKCLQKRCYKDSTINDIDRAHNHWHEWVQS